jgi:GntR family transcriptional regulator/MocR family aminotransferase
MRIPIDRESDTPIYVQLEQYLRQSIESGLLAPDTRLPAARQFAQDLGISRVTVENAYAMLEADGLVLRRTGSGTFVAAPATQFAQPGAVGQNGWPLWQLELASEQSQPQAPAQEPLNVHPNPISFTGFGDPRHFPANEFQRAIREVIRRDGTAAFSFGDPQGYEPLRATIAHVLASQGLRTSADTVLITTGSQQALALIAQVLLRPGDAVLVEQPTYDVALELFRSLNVKVIGCPTDAWGMQVEQLEPLLQQQHPRLIYTIPNFQNPSGVCMSTARRHQLIALADRYNIPILEDDFVGDLRYDGRVQPALKALDPGGRVIYVGTFSKVLMPGLRIGYLVAEGPIFERLVHLKRVYDLATSTLTQRALEVYMTVGRYQAHIVRSSQIYRKRRDAMLQAIERWLPPGTQVLTPQGGLFMWVRLPEPLSAVALQPLALESGVRYAVGTRFFPRPSEGERFLRLNFATQAQPEIEEGIRRLAAAARRL